MDQEAANLSGSLVLRGIVAILFGIAAVFWPHLTIVTLVYLFSAFILIDGIVNLVHGVGRLVSGNNSIITRVVVLLLGIFQVGIGVYLLRHPQVTFTTFIVLIGLALIARGIFEILEGLFDEGSAMYRVVMTMIGLLAIAVGIIVLFQPVASGVAFVWLLGVYALITGPLTIALAMDVNRAAKPNIPVRVK